MSSDFGNWNQSRDQYFFGNLIGLAGIEVMKKIKVAVNKSSASTYEHSTSTNAGQNSMSSGAEEPSATNLQLILQPLNTPKKKSRHQYSIVTAAYNVELYLKDFFEALTNQTLDFQSSIEIIIVDDGSTDHTSEIIKNWVAHYPKNIRYIWQENAGQAEARNTGLEYARYDWVTFIDADDFIALDYFEKISEFIDSANAAQKPLKMISNNYCFFMEDLDEVRNSHPLRFRFAKGDCILPATNPGKHIQLSVNSVILKRTRILEKNLKFNGKIRPAFEDGNFVNKYLLGLEDGYIAFLSSATYYYRKRGDGSSTLDTAWEKPGRYEDQLKLGYLDLIDESLKKYGHVKEFVQRVIFYDISWHFKRFLNSDSLLSHLDASRKKRYTDLISEIMSHISEKTIMDFELAGIWFYHKMGLLSFFKKIDPKLSIVYIEEVDFLKDLVKLRHFSPTSDCKEQFTWDGEAIVPVFSKTREHRLYDQPFVYERIVWVRMGDFNHLDAKISNKVDTRISLRGKQHRKGVSTNDIRDAFRKSNIDESMLPQEIVDIRRAAQSTESILKYGGCWILMDRDTQADDNAEHLYRYLMNHRKEVRAFFVLNENSPDWGRLQAEQFNLIPFGSLEHKLALLNASHLVSSHADHYILGGLAKNHYNDLTSYRYTFLQHGVIKDDLSSWLNVKTIDCFITTTTAEYKSIWTDGPYKFSLKEVALTGLARHDRLRSLGSDVEKVLLIMPTWRQALVGDRTAAGNERHLIEDFSSTDYAKAWKGILHSEQLKSLCDSAGYKVVFFPHANIQPYLHEFAVPSYIEVGTHHEGESIQTHFAKAAVMITDYSSVAFEMAALCRAVIYYQFDSETVLNGGHIYRQGYYDYTRDGFGPVCLGVSDVIEELKSAVVASGVPREPYLARIQNIFKFNDQLNCERIYNVIDALDKTSLDPDITLTAALECARTALSNEDWRLAIKAWERVLLQEANASIEAFLGMATSHRKLGDFKSALTFLAKAKIIDNSTTDNVAREEFALALDSGDINSANHIYNEYVSKFGHGIIVDDSFLAQLAKICRLDNNIAAAMEKIEHANRQSHPDIMREKAELASCSASWIEAYVLWADVILADPSDYALLKLAQACRQTGNPQEAQAHLSKIHSSDTLPGYNLEAAKTFFANAKWRPALALMIRELESHDISPDHWLMLAKLYRKLGYLAKAKEAFANASEAADERFLHQERALLHAALGEWNESVVAWEFFISRKDLRPSRDTWLHLSKARFETGDYITAEKDLETFETLYGTSKRSEELRLSFEALTPVNLENNPVKLLYANGI